MKRLLMGLMLLMMSCSATSGESNEIAILSFSETSCGQWTESNKKDWQRQIYVYWFRGFASGYNYGSEKYGVKLERFPDIPTLELYVDKFCRENPLLPFISAAFPLVRELRSPMK